MNTYSKFAPNVFLAKCTEKHEKGETISVETKHGKENESIVFNLIFEKDGFFYYSIVRADGFNAQEYALRKIEKLQTSANNLEQKSTQFWKASNEGKDFLSMGEPIKVGHHSEKRHRALIERNWNRMGKSVELSKKADETLDKVSYWESKASTINLSMPECIGFYEFELEKAKLEQDGLKNGSIERRHSFSLTYATKKVKDLETLFKTALKLLA